MNQNLYIVLHIYKTAGQTLRHNFQANFRGDAWLPMYVGPIGLDESVGSGNPGWDVERINRYVVQKVTDRMRCIFGHMAYFGMHELVSASVTPRYITFLREPVDRCVSFYYFLKNKSQNVWHNEIVERNWSLEEWFEKTKALWRYNGQLRQILLGSYEEVLTEPELTREHLEEAKRRLQQFWYVGLTEHFNEDSHYLYGRLGFWRYCGGAVINATPSKGEVSPATRQLIAERNALDLELYEYAKELRTRFIRENALAFHLGKNKALMIRQLHHGASSALGWCKIQLRNAHLVS
jgi:hypothetical protein